MTTLFTWNSSADNASWTFQSGVLPSYPTSGTWGERMLYPAGTAPAFSRATVTSATDHAIHFIYTVASYAGVSHTVCTALDASSGIVWRMDLSTAGLLRLRDTTAQLGQGSFGHAIATEYRLEAYRVGTALTFASYRVSDNALVSTVGPFTVAATAVVAFNVGNGLTIGTGTLGAVSYDAIEVRNVGAEIGVPAGGTTPLSATAVVSPSSGTPPYTQTITLTAAGGSGTYSYEMLDWGDGSTTAPQTSNVLSKLIVAGTAAGSKSWTARVTG